MTENVKVKDLKLGPIRRENLTGEMLALARFTFDRIGKHCQPTFEQWELMFLRDMHPERELILWTRMAYAFQQYSEMHPDADSEGVQKDLLSLSFGVPPKTKRQRELETLYLAVTKEDGWRAIEMYSE